MKTIVRKHGWAVTLGCALVSVVVLRVAGAFSGGPSNWMALQQWDQVISALDEPIRYVCVNNTAFDLGEGGTLNPAEHGLILDAAKARQKCTLPLIPELLATSPELVATAPKSGYGAAMWSVSDGPKRAVATVLRQLTHAGWKPLESPKGANASGYGAMLRRNNAWIFVIATPTNPESMKTQVLLSGNFHSTLPR